MNRRHFLKVLPLSPLGLIREHPPALSFEDELRQILYNSPHLLHLHAGPAGFRVFLDGVECHYVIQAVVSPRPFVLERGAVRVAIDNNGEMALTDGDIALVGDAIPSKWLIGEVQWEAQEE
jgi:hypothetical protein